ncbi:MAG: metal ABC transporter substrate-binding protein [Anaerolineae bacterium]|nr:metal ABC transporter substrate-binding protein [Anaerolineae bacterium]
MIVTAVAVFTSCAAPGARPASAPLSAGGRPEPLRVLAVETFLADIAQNVAGDRLTVGALIPIGVEPHSFQPTPADVRKVAASDVLIVNGAGLEEFLSEMLESAGGRRTVIEAAAGLALREKQAGDPKAGTGDHAHEGDPHFWLDPVAVIRYVENIRDGLSAADPAGQEVYAANAAAYIARLNELHAWIAAQVAAIPVERRLLVTNHESFGYFADRYGFTVVGAVIPSASAGASPSAREMAQLVEHIRATGAPAIFLETGSNPQLARQLAQEAGVRVVSGLYTHSITGPAGPAPTYLEMMRHNVRTMVEALK